MTHQKRGDYGQQGPNRPGIAFVGGFRAGEGDYRFHEAVTWRRDLR